MQKVPYQLLLWREGYIPEKKKSEFRVSEGKGTTQKSGNFLRSLLKEINIEIGEWMETINGYEKIRNTDLAERFEREKNIKEKILKLFEDLHFPRNENNQFTQYNDYSKKIHAHIVSAICLYKEEKLREEELKKLTENPLLSGIPGVVESILTSKITITEKVRRINSLIKALTNK